MCLSAIGQALSKLDHGKVNITITAHSGPKSKPVTTAWYIYSDPSITSGPNAATHTIPRDIQETKDADISNGPFGHNPTSTSRGMIQGYMSGRAVKRYAHFHRSEIRANETVNTLYFWHHRGALDSRPIAPPRMLQEPLPS